MCIRDRLHYIDTERELNAFQSDLFLLGNSRLMNQMRNGACLFDSGRDCSHCFQCIGLINQKKPEELNALEAQKLFEYKLYQLNLGRVADRINENFEKNGGFDEIRYRLRGNLTELFSVQAELYSKERGTVSPVSQMSRGMRCLSLIHILYCEPGREKALFGRLQKAQSIYCPGTSKAPLHRHGAGTERLSE